LLTYSLVLIYLTVRTKISHEPCISQRSLQVSILSCPTINQALSLLALLVQMYKYRRKRRCSARISTWFTALLALLYKSTNTDAKGGAARPTCVHLDLCNNYLHEMDPSIMTFVSLSYLDVSYNRLKELPGTQFACVTDWYKSANIDTLQSNEALRWGRYSVYLRYWYKSANSDS
jgi:hypothetical protein